MKYAAPVVVRDGDAWKVEIIHQGRSVSRLWVVDRTMQIGAAAVTVAGIAGVGTDPEHRKRGLALRVLRHSLAWMEARGYDASFLFGIQDFYHRVGFATCFPERGLSIDTRQAETARSPLRCRPLQPADLPAVRRLYERGNRQRTGAVVRGRGWKGFPMGSGFGVPGAVQVAHAPGARGRVLGYVVYDDVADRCRAAEVGGAGDDVYGAILAFLARRAVDLRRERVTLSVPVDHPFAVYARRFGCRDETQYPRNAGPMGRALDTGRFLTALAPELAARWPGGAAAQLALGTADGGATLTHRRGRVTVETGTKGRVLRCADGATLMQLAMGYRDADDAIAAGQLSGSAAQLDLARALWPLRVGHMWWPDRF